MACGLCSYHIFVPFLGSFLFRILCLDRQEVTGQQQIQLKHSCANLAIIWLHFINWTVWMFPLYHYMDFYFTEWSQFPRPTSFWEISDQNSVAWVQLCSPNLPVIELFSSFPTGLCHLVGQLLCLLHAEFPLPCILPLRYTTFTRWDAKHAVNGQSWATTKDKVTWCISSGLIFCDIVCTYDFIQTTFPICFGVVIQVTQHGQKGAVKAFNLTVPLGVVRGLQEPWNL